MISFELLVIGAGILAMLFAFWKTTWISKQDQGTEKMEKIGANIAEGAMSFLKAEYRVLTIFVIIGRRFFGSSSIMEISMSPWIVKARVRGIGVAVSARTPGEQPLSIKAFRC